MRPASLSRRSSSPSRPRLARAATPRRPQSGISSASPSRKVPCVVERCRPSRRGWVLVSPPPAAAMSKSEPAPAGSRPVSGRPGTARYRPRTRGCGASGFRPGAARSPCGQRSGRPSRRRSPTRSAAARLTLTRPHSPRRRGRRRLQADSAERLLREHTKVLRPWSASRPHVSV